MRNGSSYFIINSEFRVPVFSYLFNTPIRSELIKNFQLIGFVDVGSAWRGLSPFDDESQYTTIVYDNSPSTTATIRYFRNPVAIGYGAGARTKLLGYFVRADVGWGVDSATSRRPLWQFSLGLDF